MTTVPPVGRGADSALRVRGVGRGSMHHDALLLRSPGQSLAGPAARPSDTAMIEGMPLTSTSSSNRPRLALVLSAFLLAQCTSGPVGSVLGGHPTGSRWLALADAAGAKDSEDVRALTYQGLTLDEWLLFGIVPGEQWAITTTVDVEGRVGGRAASTHGNQPEFMRLLECLEYFGTVSARAVAIHQRLASDGHDGCALDATDQLWSNATNAVPTQHLADAALQALLRNATQSVLALVLRRGAWTEAGLGSVNESLLPASTELQTAWIDGWRRFLRDDSMSESNVLERLEYLAAAVDTVGSGVPAGLLAAEVECWERLLHRPDTGVHALSAASRRAGALRANQATAIAPLLAALSDAWQQWSSRPHTLAELQSGLEDIALPEVAERGWLTLMAREDLDGARLGVLLGPLQTVLNSIPVKAADAAERRSALVAAYDRAWRRHLHSLTRPEDFATARECLPLREDPAWAEQARSLLLDAFLDHPLADGATLVACLPVLQQRCGSDESGVETRLARITSRQPPLPIDEVTNELVEFVLDVCGPRHAHAGSSSVARAVADLLLARCPESPSAWRCKALVAWRCGDREQCLQALAKAEQFASALADDFELVSAGELRQALTREASWTSAGRAGALR